MGLARTGQEALPSQQHLGIQVAPIGDQHELLGRGLSERLLRSQQILSRARLGHGDQLIVLGRHKGDELALPNLEFTGEFLVGLGMRLR